MAEEEKPVTLVMEGGEIKEEDIISFLRLEQFNTNGDVQAAPDLLCAAHNTSGWTHGAPKFRIFFRKPWDENRKIQEDICQACFDKVILGYAL